MRDDSKLNRIHNDQAIGYTSISILIMGALPYVIFNYDFVVIALCLISFLCIDGVVVKYVFSDFILKCVTLLLVSISIFFGFIAMLSESASYIFLCFVSALIWYFFCRSKLMSKFDG